MFELRCFGQVALFDQVGNERVLRSRKHVGLLLYLVANARTTHTREELADLLWDGTGKRERHSLSQALYDIRTTVGDVLDVSTATVRVRPDHISYEVVRLEEAIESRDHDTALNLYRGEFAPDMISVGAEMFDRWVDSERERCRVLATLALRNAQRSTEERGDWDHMCLAALRLIRVNTYDEEAHCALMRGLWMKGDPASALRHFRSIDPQLVETWSSVTDLAARIEDSGSVREVLTVPREPVDLVGRSLEFEGLWRLWNRYRSIGGRLCVIGEPGIGKSALLSELARLAAVQVPDRGAHGRLEESGQVPIIVASTHLPVAARESYPPGAVVVFESTEAEEARRLQVEGIFDEVVTLGRLGASDLEQVLIRRVKARSWVAIAAARLSGGNPRLALDLARAIEEGVDVVGPRTSDCELLLWALGESPVLRSNADRLLAGVPREARRLARVIASVHPETAAALHDLDWDEQERLGYRELESRVLIRRSQVTLSLVHPVLAAALRAELGRSGQRRVRRVAAERLVDSGGRGHWAAALELTALGDLKGARELAEGVTTAAIGRADTELAVRAAELALRNSVTPFDRFQNGLALGKAELRVGQPRNAERIARELSDLSPEPEKKLEAQLILMRALVDDGRLGELRREVKKAVSLQAEVSDQRLQALSRLIVAEGEFKLAATPEDDAHRLAALETALEDSAGFASGTELWLGGFRSLFLSKAISDSRDAATTVLGRFEPLLREDPASRATALVEQSRAVLELRAARLHSAEQMAKSILAKRQSEDRTHANALNLIGIAQTELGRFDEARRTFRRLGLLDQELRPPEHEQLQTLLNSAQAAWFMADFDVVSRLAGEALERAMTHGERALEAEAAALLGLAAVERGKASLVRQMRARVKEIGHWMDRVQDRYLVLWFNALTDGVCRDDAAERLLHDAGKMSRTDRLAAAKLSAVAWGLTAFDARLEGACSAGVRELRTGGVGWFVRRAARVPTEFF